MLEKYLVCHRAALIGFCSFILMGCASQHSYPKISIPTSAYRVTTSKPDSNQYGIKFLVDVEPFSRQEFDGLRKQISDYGYGECNKSTISAWQVMPGQTSKDDNWMIVMFATKRKDKFAVLRVEQSGKAGEKSIQHFSIAFQDVGSGKPNLTNIKEFCD